MVEHTVEARASMVQVHFAPPTIKGESMKWWIMDHPRKAGIISHFEMKQLLSQTKEHNISSLDGHEWEIGESGQTRTCVKCFRQECCPPVWHPITSTVITTEDLQRLME